MLAEQSIIFACKDFWSPFLLQVELKSVSPLFTSNQIRYSANIGLVVRFFIVEAS